MEREEADQQRLRLMDRRIRRFRTAFLVLSGIVALYTGLKWWRSRASFLHTLAKIRSRKNVG